VAQRSGDDDRISVGCPSIGRLEDISAGGVEERQLRDPRPVGLDFEETSEGAVREPDEENPLSVQRPAVSAAARPGLAGTLPLSAALRSCSAAIEVAQDKIPDSLGRELLAKLRKRARIARTSTRLEWIALVPYYICCPVG